MSISMRYPSMIRVKKQNNTKPVQFSEGVIKRFITPSKIIKNNGNYSVLPNFHKVENKIPL